MTAATWLADRWFRPRLGAATAGLVPLAWLFGIAVRLRRAAYRRGWLRVTRTARPVIVVGNITVGGSGKTPATIALAHALAAAGARPGLVSRGYGGHAVLPQDVAPDADPAAVGDEALLLARSGFPTVIGRDRAAAAALLIARHPQCTVILCDDGLQHYALARDVEIAMVDTVRGFGNGWLLPAGPLREPVARLASVDAIVYRGEGHASADPRATRVTQRTLAWRRVSDDRVVDAAPAIWRGRRVVALAGIADPARFFAEVERQGIAATTQAFDDHHAFVAADIPANADAVLMTEKDAVKCRGFADPRCHYLPIVAELDPRLVLRVQTLIGA
jgi:tetraacyldisaccharide 4'-kinase